MKNIIAFSLWGDKQMYWIGAKNNIELAKKFYPSFVCRFYIDEEVSSELVDSLRNDNVEIVMVGQEKKYQGMFWRFEASQEEDVDIFLSRDCDSRISDRESKAVYEWMSSEKDFHIMRDHPYHTVPILGGMWGSKNGLMRKINLANLIELWRSHRTQDIVRISGHRQHTIEAYGDDQDFLAKVIYPMIKETAFEHCDFNIKFFNQVKSFPTERIDYEFVGDVFDEKNKRHPEYWKIIEKINSQR